MSINAIITTVEKLAQEGVNAEREMGVLLEVMKRSDEQMRQQIEALVGKACTLSGDPWQKVFTIAGKEYTKKTVKEVVTNWKQERNRFMNSVNGLFTEKVPGAVAIFDQNTDFLKVQNSQKQDIFNIDLKKKKVTTPFIMNDENVRMIMAVWQIAKSLL